MVQSGRADSGERIVPRLIVGLALGVVVDPAVRFGKPVIRGTRVPVDLVVGKLAGGMTPEEVAAEYGLTSATFGLRCATPRPYWPLKRSGASSGEENVESARARPGAYSKTLLLRRVGREPATTVIAG
jgi:uncharacterized protein (DUF433 family)